MATGFNPNPGITYSTQGYGFFGQGFLGSGSSLYAGFTRPSTTAVAPAPMPTPVTPKVDPTELANATYGKPMPLFAGGLARIGGAIIFGPYINAGKCSFGVSFGVPVPVDGSRVLFDIALDSRIVWTSEAGATTPGGGTFNAEAFTFRFYQGRLDQGVDPLETAQFGAEGIAYRPQMVMFLEDVPMAAFNDRVPYVAPLIGDTTAGADPYDGINLGTGMERIAHSPWAGYDASTFEAVNIADVAPAYLFKDNFNIVQLSQSISRIYRNIDLIQADKLYFRDRGSNVVSDLVLDEDTIIADESPVRFMRTEPSGQPRELELITIDPAQDYMPVASLSKRARDPLPVSSAVGKESITLPLVMDASTRQAMVTFAHYAEENARKKMTFKTLAYGLELEPGDLVTLPAVGDGIPAEIVKITGTVHDSDYTVECEAEAILRCTLAGDVSFEHVTCDNAEITAATHTFTGIDFGDADASRHLVVGFNLRMVATGQTVSGVTIGGVAATHAVTASNSGQGLISTIWHAAVPAGDSGDIAITMSGNLEQLSVHVYRFVSGSFALSDTDSAQATTSGAVSATLDIPASGAAIAVAATREGASFTWDGATASCTFVNDVETTGQRSSALRLGPETGHAISVDPSSSDRVAIAAASFAL